MTIVCIDGAIGAGKTTVLKRLGNELGVEVFLEPVEEWSQCLERFYEEPDKWGFCLNAKVLCSFARIRKHATDLDILLCERSPMSCINVFAGAGMKDPIEIGVLNEIYQTIGWEPDIAVYIRTTPESCMKRIKQRGRKEESDISIEYLEEIHKKYEELYVNTNKCVVIVDGEQDVNAVYDAVKSAVIRYSTQLLVSK